MIKGSAVGLSGNPLELIAGSSVSQLLIRVPADARPDALPEGIVTGDESYTRKNGFVFAQEQTGFRGGSWRM